MTAMDSVAFVLTVWVVVLGVILGAEKARQEWVAKRATRTAPAPEAFIPAQRAGGEPR